MPGNTEPCGRRKKPRCRHILVKANSTGPSKKKKHRTRLKKRKTDMGHRIRWSKINQEDPKTRRNGTKNQNHFVQEAARTARNKTPKDGHSFILWVSKKSGRRPFSLGERDVSVESGYKEVKKQNRELGRKAMSNLHGILERKKLLQRI